MGQMLQDSPCPSGVIAYLISLVIKETGLSRLRAILPKADLPPEVLIGYLNELEKFKENGRGLINTLKMEYIGFSNTKAKIDLAFEGKLPEEELKKLELGEVMMITGKRLRILRLNYLYKPNQAQRIFAENYRALIKNADKNYYKEMKFPEFKPLVPSLETKRIAFTENIVGKILHDTIGEDLKDEGGSEGEDWQKMPDPTFKIEF